jgi:hypothetical protein
MDKNNNSKVLSKKTPAGNKIKGLRIILPLVLLGAVFFSVFIYFNYFVKIYNIKGEYNKYIVSNNTFYLYAKDSCITVFSGKGKQLLKHDLKEMMIVSCFLSDINDDGSDEILLLTSDNGNEYGEYIRILSWDQKDSMNEIYKADFARIKPWKVQTADVDGDGKMEVSLGVYKTATFDPKPAKRPFIYNWNPHGLTPKWLGSRLSRPFEDYIFADINNDRKDELISVELTHDNKKVVNSYSWKGFGFEGYAESQAFEDVSNLKKEGNGLSARVKMNGRYKKAEFKYDGKRLKIIE